MFCFHFGAAVATTLNSTNTERYPLKKVLESLNLFSQPELPGKKRNWIILFLPATSHDQYIFGKLFPFSGNSDWENKLNVSKTYLEEYVFALVEYLCNRCPKKREQKISKIILISISTIANYRN